MGTQTLTQKEHDKALAKAQRHLDATIRAYKRYFERNPTCSNNRYLASRAENAWDAFHNLKANPPTQ